MIHIQPITENLASGPTQEFYSGLKQTLGFPTIPLYFQLIAPFNDFSTLLWSRLKPVVTNPTFPTQVDSLNAAVGQNLVSSLPSSPLLAALLPKISSSDKKEMLTIFEDILDYHTKLVLVTILVREAIKGLPRTEKVPFLKDPDSPTSQTTKELILLEIEALTNEEEKNYLTVYSGHNPYFAVYMKLVADLLAHFETTKEYLALRLFLETTAQSSIRSLPPIALTYHDVLTTINRLPYADELVFLLHDSFPGYYPKTLISSLLLSLCLQAPSSLTPQT